MPGSGWEPSLDAWVVDDPDAKTAHIILKLFPTLSEKYPQLIRLKEERQNEVRPFDNATPFNTDIVARGVRETLRADGHDLYRFQSIDLGYAKAVVEKHGAAYIGWERGLGKTLGTASLIEDTQPRRVLIVAPNTAKGSVWKPELERFLPEYTTWVLPNDKKKREAMMALVEKFDGPLCLVIHYEAQSIIAGKLKTKTGRNKVGKGWDKYGEMNLVVWDEAHRLWNTKTYQHKAARSIPAERRLMLSGSILQNRPEELYGPLHIMYPTRYSSQWRDWNDRFIEYADTDYGRVCLGFKDDKLDELRRELGVFMVYRRKEDELDLPPKTEQSILVELSRSQRKAYDELVQSCVTQLDDGTTVVAEVGLPMLTRLRQIATGLDLLGHTVADSSKLDVAQELIEDNDEPTVVFSWYKACCHTLAERLRKNGIECFVVTGDVKEKDRVQQIEKFQSGQGQVFIGTLSTLGESVNLQRASSAIFLDRSWNPALNAQAEDRIYRIGQSRPVTITHLVAQDTVDELRVTPTLVSKEALRAAILGG